MGEYHFVRTLPMTQAVNTFVNTTGEAGAGPTDITVPAGVSRIKKIRASISASVVAIASSGGNVILRLTGNGLVDGQQDFVVPSIREDTTSTAGTKNLAPDENNVDIAVKPGNSIQPQLAYTGVDPGTPEASVELVFE